MTIPPPPSIRDAVVSAMASRGMSQSDLAILSGVNRPHLNLFLNHNRGLSVASIEVIMSVLDLHVVPVEAKPKKKDGRDPKRTIQVRKFI